MGRILVAEYDVSVTSIRLHGLASAE